MLHVPGNPVLVVHPEMKEEATVDSGNLLVIGHTDTLFRFEQNDDLLLGPEVDHFLPGWGEWVPRRNDLEPVLDVGKVEHVVVLCCSELKILKLKIKDVARHFIKCTYQKKY